MGLARRMSPGVTEYLAVGTYPRRCLLFFHTAASPRAIPTVENNINLVDSKQIENSKTSCVW